MARAFHVAVALLASLVSVDAQIAPLTAVRLVEATTEGVKAPDNLVFDVKTVFERPWQAFPFIIDFESPYLRAFRLATEARRRFQPLPPLELEWLNAGGLQLIVSPRSIDVFEEIEDLVLKRGNEIIRPTSAAVLPHVMQSGDGRRRESQRGTFVFPIDTFAPDRGAITIVCVAKTNNFEWVLTPEAMAQMK